MSPDCDKWEIDRSEIHMKQRLGGGQYGDVYEALWKRFYIYIIFFNVIGLLSHKLTAIVLYSLQYTN